MTSTVTADTPGRPLLDPSEATGMPKHALVDPCPPAWPEALSSSGGFLPIGSVVPISVLHFTPDGTAEDIASDPTVIPPHIAVWAKGELAHIPSWKPKPKPSPVPRSRHCAYSWPAEYGLSFTCTTHPGHVAPHTAHDSHGDVIATCALAEVA